MNWRHLQAFVWLRWRLLYNQWRRAGAFSAILMMIVTFGALATAIPLFIGCFALGMYAIPKAEPVHLLYAWDGLVIAFLFFWTVGLVAELQRSEPLALSKFMHLPVSVNGAFLINYLSSLLRLSLIVFVPVMLAFCLAMVFTKGILLLAAVPMLAAFLLMVTALTYQLQGWLAALMSNPRRRRTVIMATTVIFVLIVQLPQLLNFMTISEPRQRVDRAAKLAADLAKVNRDSLAAKVDPGELTRRQQKVMEETKLAMQQADREFSRRSARTARLVNLVLPFGWLPLGVMTAAEGRVIPPVLGLIGMTLIGAASLHRAYRTTIGLYQGRFTSGRVRAALATAPGSGRGRRTLLLEAVLPGLSEPVTAVALGSFRSLVRSPEAKMMLLTPLIMVPIFGSMLWRGRHTMPEPLRPLVAIGGMVLVLFGVLQLMGNQFGFDRDGFRVFVLSAAHRRDILLGKNLSFVPLALGLGAIVLLILQAVSPLRLDHFLAMFPQYVSMFLLFCILTNFLSIFTPVHVAAGSLKASSPTLSTVFLQMVTFFFLFPLTQGLTLLPLAIDAVLTFFGWNAGVPLGLVLTVIECAAIVAIYHFTLYWQGEMLQSQEQKILDVVTKRAV